MAAASSGEFFGVNRSSLPAIEEIQMSQLGGFSHLSVTQESAQDQSTLQSTLHSTLPAFRRSTGEAASSVFPMSQQRASMLPTSYLPGSKGASTTSLTPSCFSLVLVFALRDVRLWMPLLVVIPISVAQFAVLYIISFKSPQYMFANGHWLVPHSSANSLNAMKLFATVLMLGQLAEEFREIGESMSVLRSSRLQRASRKRLATCWIVISLQYVLALSVLVAAEHLILSRENPIEPLWITYYVFMTLNFDNMLVNFWLYVQNMERTRTWRVELEKATAKPQERRRCDWQRLFVLWLPFLLSVMLTVCCRVWNVLPMTFLCYGYVTNEQPVAMLSNLNLPGGCCSAVAQINKSQPSGNVISVSVPCLARDAPEDDLGGKLRPIVYWVAWPGRRVAPSSLQVREGRGGDGSRALLAGSVVAKPLELVPWMQSHDYKGSQIRKVFEELTDEEDGLGMYRFTFPFVAEFQAQPWPWTEEAKIYAVAQNVRTGALSALPAPSNVLHSKLCPPHCEQCNRQGKCRKCQAGSVIHGDSCLVCAEGCSKCVAEQKTCLECEAGFGLVTTLAFAQCMPCDSQHCQQCDGKLEVHPPHSRFGLVSLPCKLCIPGWGLDVNGTCEQCEAPHCLSCMGAWNCTECEEGFVRVQEEDDGGSWSCQSCGPACHSCSKIDACDVCQAGFTQQSGVCKPCGSFCNKCDKAGANGCDEGGCAPGYGLQRLRIFSDSCQPCLAPNCETCAKKRDICELCKKDFGLTSAGRCAVCGQGCKSCKMAGKCDECDDGFILQDQRCLACSDRCLRCSAPGKCDEGGCEKGWTAVAAPWTEGFVCRPCSDPQCPSCDLRGPGHCDMEEVPVGGAGGPSFELMQRA
ncbi:unnamed protein product [Effrenium voratum]|uniref:EGF-like domain-containing protein n=1 Tax=Effrenium voratum TaxID=2562239 RepID=A0AA36JTD2_9DINO|nr:unnamed protein product [Effrenium voratum]